MDRILKAQAALNVGLFLLAVLLVCDVHGLRSRIESLKGRVKALEERIDVVRASPTRSVNWVGNPAVRTGDKFFSNVGWLPEFETGMRDDGFWVWRKDTNYVPRSGTNRWWIPK